MANKQGVSELLLYNFAENGVKFLLHNAGNLEDLFRILAFRDPTLFAEHRFDCSKRTIEPETLIRSDFSHGITDLLIRLPCNIPGHPKEWVELYLLIEHLSTHQRLIVPRSLGYAMDAYRLQERRWREKHSSLQGLEYEAVIPVAIYTGERPWKTPTPFRDVVKAGKAFAQFIPLNEILFLSLPSEDPQQLMQAGGALGNVFHVLQNRHAEFTRFQQLLTTTVETIQDRVTSDKHRLRELLAYLQALVYHFRIPEERPDLTHDLTRSVHRRRFERKHRWLGKLSRTLFAKKANKSAGSQASKMH